MFDKIYADIVSSMKSKDTLRLATLRMLKGAIDLERINKKVDKLNDDDIIVIIGKQIKTRKESIIEFEKGNREDLVDKTKKEIEILSEYMPVALGDDELNKIIDEIIKNLDASTIKDMGNVMKEVSSRVKGRADMSLVSSIIKNKLN